MEAENVVQMDLFGGKEPVKAAALRPAARTLPKEPEPDMVRVAPGRHAWVPKNAATPPDGYAL